MTTSFGHALIDDQARQSHRQALADIRDALGPASTILVTGEDAVGLDRGRVVSRCR